MDNRAFSAGITPYYAENGAGSRWTRRAHVDKRLTSNEESPVREDPVADIATHATHLLRLLNEIKPGRVEQELGAKIQALETQVQNAEAKLLSRQIEIEKKDQVIQAAAAREQAIGKLVVRLSAECEELTAELYEKSLTVTRLEGEAGSGLGCLDIWKRIMSLLQQAASRLKLTGSAPEASSPPHDRVEERAHGSD